MSIHGEMGSFPTRPARAILEAYMKTAYPKTPQPIVDLIQALFLQGLRYPIIAKQLGLRKDTVRSMIKRKGWQTTKDEAKAIAALPVPKQIKKQNQSERIRSTLTEVIEADLLAAAKTRPSLKRQAQLEPLVRNAKVALGWGEGHTQVLVNIQSLDPDSSPLLLDATEVLDTKAIVISPQTPDSESSSGQGLGPCPSED